MGYIHAVEGIFTIIIMVSLGCFLTAQGWFTKEVSGIFPKLVLYIALPAYMVWNLVTTFDREKMVPLLFGLVVPLISVTIAFIIGYVVSYIIKIGPGKRGVFVSAFSSASAIFLGIPVNIALFGETSITYVLIYSIANAFLYWTIINYAISQDGQKRFSIISRDTLKNVISPPLIGFAVGVGLVFAGLSLPRFLIDALRYLGSMTTPLSMLFVGITLFGVKFSRIRLSKDVIAVLLGRFIICGAITAVVTCIIPIPELMRKVFIIESILPASTTTTILSQLYEADPEYASLLVSVTTVFSVIAIPVYMIFISSI